VHSSGDPGGSHIVMQRRTAKTTITMTVPGHAGRRIGTLRSIVRQSEVPRSVIEE